jgi:hypothetical protein
VEILTFIGDLCCIGFIIPALLLVSVDKRLAIYIWHNWVGSVLNKSQNNG